MSKLNGVRVNVDGTVEKFTTEQNLWEYLGFWITTVRVNKNLVIVVDDEGLLKGKKPNVLATLYSGYPNTLVGDGVFLKEGFTDDGPDFVEMTDEEQDKLYMNLLSLKSLKMI